jgi:hypothetical protein
MKLPDFQMTVATSKRISFIYVKYSRVHIVFVAPLN